MWWIIALVWLVATVVHLTVDFALCLSPKDFSLRRSWLGLVMHPFMFLEQGNLTLEANDGDDLVPLCLLSLFWLPILPVRLTGIVLNIYHGWYEKRAKRLAEPPVKTKSLAEMTAEELMVELDKSATALKIANDRFQGVRVALREKRLSFDATLEAASAADPNLAELLSEDDELAEKFRELEHQTTRSA